MPGLSLLPIDNFQGSLTLEQWLNRLAFRSLQTPQVLQQRVEETFTLRDRPEPPLSDAEVRARAQTILNALAAAWDARAANTNRLLAGGETRAEAQARINAAPGLFPGLQQFMLNIQPDVFSRPDLATVGMLPITPSALAPYPVPATLPQQAGPNLQSNTPAAGFGSQGVPNNFANTPPRSRSVAYPEPGTPPQTGPASTVMGPSNPLGRTSLGPQVPQPGMVWTDRAAGNSFGPYPPNRGGLSWGWGYTAPPEAPAMPSYTPPPLVAPGLMPPQGVGPASNWGSRTFQLSEGTPPGLPVRRTPAVPLPPPSPAVPFGPVDPGMPWGSGGSFADPNAQTAANAQVYLMSQTQGGGGKGAAA